MAQENDTCAINTNMLLRDNVERDSNVLSARNCDTVYVLKTLVDSLVECKNYHCLKEELHRLHNLNRVMYGRMDMILDTRPCYIVVFDYRGDIVAFLEPGDERRVDLVSNKQVELDEYAYYLKLWLIVY